MAGPSPDPSYRDVATSAGSGQIPSPPPQDASPEEKDAYWFQHVYQGDRMPQLTVRAVVMGGLLGMLMSASNLYTTLSIGWAFGVAITACVMSFVIWNAMRILSGGRLSQMSILENACMASTASAAGYSTGSTIATMFGSLVLLYVLPEGMKPGELKTWDVTPVWIVVIFTLCTGLMGVFLAIPMKRQMINHEQLPFPTGTAAAETLRSLYSQSKEALQKAYVLVVGLGAGLVIGFLRAPQDVLDAVPFLKRLFDKIKMIRIPGEVGFHFLDRFYPGRFHPAGFAFEPSALLIAAGMIVGMRISLSLVLSSLLLYAGVAPKLAHMDAQATQQSAFVIHESATAAITANKDADVKVAIAAVATAAEDAAKRFPDLDAAAIGTLAREAGEGVLTEREEEIAAAKARAEKKGKTYVEPVMTEDDVKNLRKAALEAATGAAAGRAATTLENLKATQAAAAEKTKALEAGSTEEEAQKAADLVFADMKYKRNFIWDFGGGQVVLARWALWGGTSVMVFASLASVGLQWRTIARAFTGGKGDSGGEFGSAAMKRVEVPGKWMIAGMLPITIAMVWLQIEAFKVAWWAGIIAVAMSFVLSMVASRATGETDTTPIGAMGKVMQFLFALLAPGNQGANLASAGIAANSASSSADLLTDLKTGYLLGANPRKQFLAQFFGVFFGTVAIVPIWYLMVPTREKLESFALPATRSWEAVARLLTEGVKNLPESAIWAIFIGAAIGVILPIIERLLPAKARKYMPSATGIGLAWVMPFTNAFSFFVGAVIIMIWMRVNRKTAEKFNVPVASGLIAGESLMLAGLAITATLVGLLSV